MGIEGDAGAFDVGCAEIVTIEKPDDCDTEDVFIDRLEKVTPVGGVLLIANWLSLLFSAGQKRQIRTFIDSQ